MLRDLGWLIWREIGESVVRAGGLILPGSDIDVLVLHFFISRFSYFLCKTLRPLRFVLRDVRIFFLRLLLGAHGGVFCLLSLFFTLPKWITPNTTIVTCESALRGIVLELKVWPVLVDAIECGIQRLGDSGFV